ncbi:hypothetical protein [Polaribacter glomeratus]|uniref:Uncharacterized protein n=1 Tax=Polaribacter glomeratus TaxID=102 RepID=A0A2S7WW79_9FLAO|nr:hypothetical protein [Polaribacter glomeratus]PQJ81860.1 hypothetical protein BTO16_04415 [Polaribacter glomeratus]TXD66216.1 hypothetical protein ESX12_05355 [Polaribacter glomeratus]
MNQKENKEVITIEIEIPEKPTTEFLTDEKIISLDLEEIENELITDEITLEDLEIDYEQALSDEFEEDFNEYNSLDEIDLNFDETFE